MHLPGTMSLLFLAYLLVILPLLAYRSSARLRDPQAKGPGATWKPLSRVDIMASTLMMLTVLFLLAWRTGWDFDYRIFSVPRFGWRELLAGLIVLGLHFALRRLLVAARTEEERRRTPARAWMPRNGREWVLGTVVSLAAGVAEETAYRGVGMAILRWSLGSPLPAAPVLAVAFALVHWAQGWKSLITIFFMALLMHALVEFTGTLAVAMGVHTIYDIGAMLIYSRDAAARAKVEAAN